MLDVCACVAVGDGLYSNGTACKWWYEMSRNDVDRETVSSLLILAVCAGVLV